MELLKSGKLIEKQIKKLQKKANWIRNKILEMGVKAGVGHIAPAFSCVEIITALYYSGALRVDPKNPKWVNRDRFILSKGHAALTLYVVLADLEFFPVSELMGFAQDGSHLGGHAENSVPGVEAFTGSLGHGLSIATGIALSTKMDAKKNICVALLGDGECHEGSTWEAAMFAAHHRLNKLIAIVDYNGLSATNFLKTYLDVAPLNRKWESFGWDVVTVNGHSFEDLISLFDTLHSRQSNKPLMILALTTKGKGISFMESNPIWHFRIPVGKELKIAKKELSIINKSKEK